MTPKRRAGRQKQHTISCRDSEWERVRVRAEAAGMSISRYVVMRALATELVRDAGGRQRLQPRLVLGEDEQKGIRDRVALIADRLAVPDAPMEFERLQNRVQFIVDATVIDMIRSGRVREMTAILVEVLGQETGGKVAAGYVDRARRQAGPD